MGDFFYLSGMKDLSGYIHSLLDNATFDYQVTYNGGEVYVIDVFLTDIRYTNNSVKLLLQNAIAESIDQYIPKGTIEYAVKINIDNNKK
jgi:hypothetical protein